MPLSRFMILSTIFESNLMFKLRSDGSSFSKFCNR